MPFARPASANTFVTWATFGNGQRIINANLNFVMATS